MNVAGLEPDAAGCLPRRLERLKNDRWPEADRSRLEAWPGGGGKAGDIGTWGELLVDASTPAGEEVKATVSSRGEGPAVADAKACASPDPAL